MQAEEPADRDHVTIERRELGRNGCVYPHSEFLWSRRNREIGHTRGIQAVVRKMPDSSDSVAERSGFEPSVPLVA